MNESFLPLEPHLLKTYDKLFQVLHFDVVDWKYIIYFANRWKLSVIDALLDLNYLDETILSKAVARSFKIPYIPKTKLEFDFSIVTIDNFEDLLSVGAVPLKGYRLALFNPYDDLHGYLGNAFCEREMVISERSAILSALRQHGLRNMHEDFVFM